VLLCFLICWVLLRLLGFFNLLGFVGSVVLLGFLICWGFF
jgi:hypothetical protein